MITSNESITPIVNADQLTKLIMQLNFFFFCY